MGIGRVAIAAAIVLAGMMTSSAQAANCGILQGHYQQFESDRTTALKELARADAAHHPDGHFHHDQAACMALRQTEDDTLLLLIVDDSCFRSKEGAAEFKAGILTVGQAAAGQTGFYCSPADMKAPLRPSR